MRIRRLILPLALLSSAPAAAVELSGEVGAVSDYRYRGVSLSGRNPAVQGSVTVEHESGLYAELWGSTLGDSNPGNVELDFNAGYSKQLSEHFSIEVYATRYVYPAAGSQDYFEGTATATLSRGPASASLGLSYAPPQSALRDDSGRRHDNVYLSSDATYELPKTPVTLIAHAGHERGAFDEAEGGGKWDWTLGGEVKLNALKLGLSYTGSNADGGDRHGIVASAFVEW